MYKGVCTWPHKTFLSTTSLSVLQKTFTRGVTDLWQATSALLGLVREPAQAPHASQFSILVSVIMEILLLTGQNISCFCLLCKIKGTAPWEGGEPPPWQDLCSTWRENPSGYQFTAAQKLGSQNLKGHQTYSLSVFLVLFLLKQLFIKQFAVRPFLLRSGKISLSPSQPPLFTWSKPF